MTLQEWIGRVERREARVGIIGLGYVGLPLALEFGRAGFAVLGFDIDPAKVEKLNRGESYIFRIAAEEIAAARAQGLMRRPICASARGGCGADLRADSARRRDA